MVVSLSVGLATAEVSALLAISVLLLAALLAGLWRGNRFAWCTLLALEVSIVVSHPFDPPAWWAVLANLAGLALLLVPQTRRYVWRKPREPRATQTGATAA